MSDTRPELRPEGCPICHRTVSPGQDAEWVAVCPLLYPEVKGLRCHQACLEQQRERTRFLQRDDLRPAFLRRRADGR